METIQAEGTLKDEEPVAVQNEPEVRIFEAQPLVETPGAGAVEPDAAKRRRRELSLSEKVQLIHESQEGTKSQRQLASIYQIGKTTVHEILKKKEEILRAFEENYQYESGRKRMCNRSIYGDINKLTWQWYERARAQGKQISGPMIQEKAKSFAAELDLNEFRASNGWLEGFRRRHGISFSSSFTPSYETSVNVTTEWTEKILEVTEGYRSTDIYNLVETGMYYRALPDKALVADIRSDSSNERLTISLCCNMDGEFEKPIVIGQEASPPCFRNFDKEGLPVLWRANRRAWITTTIFADWLRSFDRNMRKQERRVLLFLDNSPPHPPNLQLTNVKLVFLIKPSSSGTNQLQPLTQGILDVFRMAFRRKVLHNLLAKLDNNIAACSAKHLMWEINELDACFWIASTLEEISGSTMMKCFESAGFLVNLSVSLSSYSMAFPSQREGLSGASLSPLNSSTPKTARGSKLKGTKHRKTYATDGLLEELVTMAAQKIFLRKPMTAKEYAAFDADIKVADDLSEGWEERLVEDFCQNKKSQTDEMTPSTTLDAENPRREIKENVIHTYPEALEFNKNLIAFALEENDSELLGALYKVEGQLQQSHMKRLLNARQRNLDTDRDVVASNKPHKHSSRKTNSNHTTTSCQGSNAGAHEPVYVGHNAPETYTSNKLSHHYGTVGESSDTLSEPLSGVITHHFTNRDDGQGEVIVEIPTSFTTVPESASMSALISGASGENNL